MLIESCDFLASRSPGITGHSIPLFFHRMKPFLGDIKGVHGFLRNRNELEQSIVLQADRVALIRKDNELGAIAATLTWCSQEDIQERGHLDHSGKQATSRASSMSRRTICSQVHSVVFRSPGIFYPYAAIPSGLHNVNGPVLVGDSQE